MVSNVPDRNIKHKCAAYAYNCISDVLKEPGIQGKYRSEVLSVGTRIHDSGLLQTLAFCCSKMKGGEKPGDRSHFRELALYIMKWILREEQIDGDSLDTSKWDESDENIMSIFAYLLEPHQSDERMLIYTHDALEVTQWLKRFADARLKKD